MKNRILLTIMLLIILVSLTATSYTAESKEVVYPVKAGQTVLLPCESGVVKAFTTDGMGVVECLGEQ